MWYYKYLLSPTGWELQRKHCACQATHDDAKATGWYGCHLKAWRHR